MNKDSDEEKELLNRFQKTLVSIAKNSGPPRLLAVSKSHPSWMIRTLLEKCRHLDFGENRLTELKLKITELPNTIHWAYLGPLQSHHWKNLQSMDVRISTLASEAPIEWANARPPVSQRKSLIQVCVESKENRTGVPLGDVEKLMKAYTKCPYFSLEGFLFMPLVERTLAERREQFLEVKRVFDKMKNDYRNSVSLNTLSMGMSDDFELALECGSTEVRIGTQIFGERAVH